MAEVKIPFALHSYRARSRPLSQQRLVNGYMVRAPEGSKTVSPVYRTPGIKAWTTSTSGNVRGMSRMEGVLYVVSGHSLYAVNPDGASSVRGDAMITGNGRVSMATDGDSLVIAHEGSAWFYDRGSAVLAPIDDEHFLGADQVEWLDGYFIYLVPDSDKFQISNVAAPNTIDVTDFATAETDPDRTVGILVDHGQLFQFGQRSVEIWAIRPGSTFPFIRYSNGRMEIGCAAANSPAKGDNSVFWLADDLSCRVLRDILPLRISTDAIEDEWSKYSTVADAHGSVLTLGGRLVYTLTFPTAKATWQYDLGSSLWNELESYDKGRWRGEHYIHCYGKHLISDFSTSNIGELDIDTYSEWDEPLIWKATSAPIVQQGHWLFHEGLRMDFETGVGLEAGQGSDPQVMLRWSDDSKTFSNVYQRSLGNIGAYRHEVNFYGLGRAKNRVYECSVSDPIPIAMMGALAEIELGER